VLVGVSLADAAGERRPQNLPGTTTQYPNWCVPLADGDGQPVLLEDLATHPGVRAVAAAVSPPGGRAPGSAAPARGRPAPR